MGFHNRTIRGIWQAQIIRYASETSIQRFAANFSKSGGSPEKDDVDGIGTNFGKQFCYMIFDILYVNDKSVMDLPLQQRTLLLRRCVKPLHRSIDLVEQKQARTVQEVIDALDQAIMKRLCFCVGLTNSGKKES